MKTLKKLPRVLLIPAFLVVCLSLYGQEIKEYRGVMKMDENIPTLQGHSGEGYYQYYLSPEGKRVKHGKYEFKSNNISISGQFVDGKKTGKWSGGMFFSTKSGKLDIKIIGLATEAELLGITSYANSFVLSYVDDKLHGSSQYKIQFEAKYSEHSSLFLSNLTGTNNLIVDCAYDNDHLSGNIFFSYSGGKTIKGQFDEEGLADGVWTDTETPYITYYEYSHGFRKKAYRYDDSTGETEQLANEECAKVESLFNNREITDFGWFLSDVDGCFISWGKRNWKSCTPVEIEVDESGIPIEDSMPYQLVNPKKPEFQGGDLNNFSKWVNDNLVYPKSAKENGIQGRVTLEFVVHSNGKLANVRVLRGVEPELDKEAVRVVSESPLWTPGYGRDGIPVATKCTCSVIFQLR